jgi:hypothetical protein
VASKVVVSCCAPRRFVCSAVSAASGTAAAHGKYGDAGIMDHGVRGEGTHDVLVHTRQDAVALGKARHTCANGFDDAEKFVAHDRVLAEVYALARRRIIRLLQQSLARTQTMPAIA